MTSIDRGKQKGGYSAEVSGPDPSLASSQAEERGPRRSASGSTPQPFMTRSWDPGEPGKPDGAHGDPLLGKTLAGRYAIRTKIGEGGMGAVYLAQHVSLEKSVAVKVLRRELSLRPNFVNRFLQEAQAASRIRHENVIDITDFGKTPEGQVFFTMEYLEGIDLSSEFLRPELSSGMAWPRAKHIFLQTCAALRAVHNVGIVHRDLKPENIFLVNHLGAHDFVKLLDFGVAKMNTRPESEPRLTSTGILIGTPQFMAPERARGRESDARSDIYAMGCLLYKMVSGRVPFDGSDFMGVLSKHLTEDVPALDNATAITGAPESIKTVVSKALAKDPDSRYQSVDELIDAILDICDLPTPFGSNVNRDATRSKNASASPANAEPWVAPVASDRARVAPPMGLMGLKASAISSGGWWSKRGSPKKWVLGVSGVLALGLVAVGTLTRTPDAPPRPARTPAAEPSPSRVLAPDVTGRPSQPEVDKGTGVETNTGVAGREDDVVGAETPRRMTKRSRSRGRRRSSSAAGELETGAVSVPPAREVTPSSGDWEQLPASENPNPWAR